MPIVLDSKYEKTYLDAIEHVDSLVDRCRQALINARDSMSGLELDILELRLIQLCDILELAGRFFGILHGIEFSGSADFDNPFLNSGGFVESIVRFRYAVDDSVRLFDAVINTVGITGDRRDVAVVLKLDADRLEAANDRTIDSFRRCLSRFGEIVSFEDDIDDKVRKSNRLSDLNEHLDQLRLSPIVEKVQKQAVEAEQARDLAVEALEVTRRAAGATSESALASHFGKYADEESRSADIFRAGTISCLLFVAAVATLLVIFVGVGNGNVTADVEHVAIIVPIAVLAAYLGRESGRHRQFARSARELQVRLLTFDAFIEPLTDSQKEAVRTEFAKRIYTVQEVEISNEPGPSIVSDTAGLLGKVADLLKNSQVGKSKE